MTTVTGCPPLGASVDVDDFTDLTAAAVVAVSWGSDGRLVVEFDGELTGAETLAVADRIASRNRNEETLRGRARKALAVNRNYLGLTAPGQADVVAQVAALTRQAQGLIRLALTDLDGTD